MVSFDHPDAFEGVNVFTHEFAATPSRIYKSATKEAGRHIRSGSHKSQKAAYLNLTGKHLSSEPANATHFIMSDLFADCDDFFYDLPGLVNVAKEPTKEQAANSVYLPDLSCDEQCLANCTTNEQGGYWEIPQSLGRATTEGTRVRPFKEAKSVLTVSAGSSGMIYAGTMHLASEVEHKFQHGYASTGGVSGMTNICFETVMQHNCPSSPSALSKADASRDDPKIPIPREHKQAKRPSEAKRKPEIYYCDLCPQIRHKEGSQLSFTRADGLRRHQKSFHGSSTYRCRVCGRSTRDDKVMEHCQKRHGIPKGTPKNRYPMDEISRLGTCLANSLSPISPSSSFCSAGSDILYPGSE